MNYNTEFRSNEDKEAVLENYEIDDVTETEELTHNAQNVADISILHQQYFHSDDKISANIRSFTSKQREDFHFVHSRAKDIVKQRSSKKTEAVKPFHLFLSDSVGFEKFHLIKRVYHSVS